MVPALVTGGVVVGIALFFLVMRARGGVAAAGRAEVEKHYRPEDIVLMAPDANSFGVESAGATQLRGNGGLVLTSRELHFFMLAPRRDLRIPLEDIREVKTVRTHLGKTVEMPLLHVRWTTAEHGDDAIAWWVRDVDAWKTKLADLRM